MTATEAGSHGGSGAAPGIPDEGAESSEAAVRGPTRADRILLGAFYAYVLLLLVAAYAQITDNRTLLDLFDLRRLFTR